MDRLLARLERKLGRFAIENLTLFIVGGMAMVFVISKVRPDFIGHLTLNPWLAPKEPWRFVTYLFIPQRQSDFWILFSLYWVWFVGTTLENEWGAFKLNVYYLVGAIGTTIAAYLVGPQGNSWLNLSLLFALGTIFPDYEIRIMFVVPIRLKWVALLSFAPVAFYFVIGDLSTKAAIGVAFGNYLLFFGGHLLQLARGEARIMRQAQRRASFRPPPEREAAAKSRACAICGVRQDDGADIRVCSCEKCGGPRDLCLEHARNH